MVLNKIRLIILFLSLIISNSSAKGQGFSSTTALFLTIIPDAEGRSFGGAYTSIGDSPSSLYYNPASVNNTELFDFTINTLPYLWQYSPEDFSMKNINVIIKVPKFRNVGFSYTKLDLGETVNIIENDIVKFDIEYNAFSLTMGGKLLKKTLYGISIRHIRQPGIYNREKGATTKTSYSVDVGMLKENVFSRLTIKHKIPFEFLNKFDLPTVRKKTNGMSFGVSLNNFGPRVKFPSSNQKDPLPQTFRIGTSYYLINNGVLSVRIAHDRYKFIVSYDEDSSEADVWYKAIINSWGEDSPIWIKQYGLEIKFFNAFSIRRGIEQDDRYRGVYNNLVNLDSRSIIIGSGGFRLVYAETDIVKRHSVWDAIKDPSVFRDYTPNFIGRIKSFTFSLSF